jgi:hypothetical protein
MHIFICYSRYIDIYLGSSKSECMRSSNGVVRSMVPESLLLKVRYPVILIPSFSLLFMRYYVKSVEELHGMLREHFLESYFGKLDHLI